MKKSKIIGLIRQQLGCTRAEATRFYRENKAGIISFFSML